MSRRLLAIDTVSSSLGLALMQDGRTVYKLSMLQKSRHAEALMPAVNTALQALEWRPEDLQAIAVTVGPGSFTGVRIGVCSAKGLAYALGIPVLQVNALDALAENATGWADYAFAAMDARNHQVYAALYHRKTSTWEKVHSDTACSIEEALAWLPATPVACVGEGAIAYAASLVSRSNALLLPQHLAHIDAGAVARLADTMAQDSQSQAAMEVLPLYLRTSQAQQHRTTAHSTVL